MLSFTQTLKPWLSFLGLIKNLKSSDPAVKIHQHYLNIFKAFGLFRKSYIDVYGPDIEILVSEFITYKSVRILISVSYQKRTKLQKQISQTY